MSSLGLLHILRVTVDGHCRGGEPLRPWVAELTGTCPRYGLARTFLTPKNDYRDARRSWSGNMYGKVATFELRRGRVYEVARAEGSSSRRHLARRFFAVEKDLLELEPEAALELVDGGARAAVFTARESPETWVGRVRGLGTPERLGFALRDGIRTYRLVDGLYEVVEAGDRRFVGVRGLVATRLTEPEAIAWIR